MLCFKVYLFLVFGSGFDGGNVLRILWSVLMERVVRDARGFELRGRVSSFSVK